MKVYTVIIGFSLLLLNQSHALAQQGISSAKTNITVSHPAGQTNYIAANESSRQPYTISVLAGTETKSIDLTYSNPASDFVTLTVQPASYRNMSLRLFTVKGKVILDQPLTFGQSTIMLPDYSSPQYMLCVYNNDKEVKSYKIIKNR